MDNAASEQPRMVCPFCGRTTAGPDACDQCGRALPPTPAPDDVPGLPKGPSSTHADGLATMAAPADSTARGVVPAAGGPLTTGDMFGPRYRILRVVGEGGMGVVYHAWDHELGVAVALKVIRREITSDPVQAMQIERRFKRELLLSRQVTHRNVVRIHDLGEVDRIKYISMPFVEGENLARMLAVRGRLPLPEALKITRQVADGLAAAHAAGVVHRDLKPENIMVEADGLALIMDFGISRSATLDTTPAQERTASPLAPPGGTETSTILSGMTVAGAIVGTFGYMAPEQAKGQPVDQRADIYAFGLIVRDMLLGRRQLGDESLADLVARIEQAPPSLRAVDPQIPEPVDGIVTRCLQPDPAARYQTTRELIGDLDRLDDQGERLPEPRKFGRKQMAAAAVLVLSLVGGTWWLARTRVPPAEPDPVSVLVADFENRANDPVFDGAVEQALAIAMEEASFVTAYPRRNAQQIAEELKPGSGLDESMARIISAREGIKVILAGAVEPTGAGYTVSVRALDPALDPQSRPLAAASASARSKEQVLSAVASLASRIRGALGDTTPESARTAAAETMTSASLEAMRAYSLGQELAAANRIPDAIGAYEQAVALDPRFGRAYAGMGVIYANIKQEDRARASFEQALKHVDRMTDRERHRTLGNYALLVSRNYEQAVESFRELVRLYPADDVGHANLALAYLHVGNLPGAVDEVRKALDIYPKDFLSRYNYAMYSMYAGDFETAVAEGMRVLEENATFGYALIPIGASNLARGEIQAARAAYARLGELGDNGPSLALLGNADLEMYLGRHKAALAMLQAGIAADEKQESSGETAQKHVAAAEAFLATGDRRRAAAAALKAASVSSHEGVLFPAARALMLAGEDAEAERIATRLENMLQRQTVGYSRLIAGEIAVRQGRLAAGLEALREGQRRHNSWFSHFLLGRTYAEAGHHPEALAEFELCLKRRGEATDVFFYDTPTLRYFPPVYYWLARTQEQLGVRAEAQKNYEEYLKLRADADTPDPLAQDARRRLGAAR